MPNKIYTSGNPDTKSDFYVEFTPAISGGIKVDIQTSTPSLHISKLYSVTNRALLDMGIIHGKLSIALNNLVFSVVSLI